MNSTEQGSVRAEGVVVAENTVIMTIEGHTYAYRLDRKPSLQRPLDLSPLGKYLGGPFNGVWYFSNTRGLEAVRIKG